MNKEYAYKVLDDIGVPVHLKGYESLAKAISLAMESGDRTMGEIYKLIEGHPSSIERHIRHSVAYLLNNGDMELIQKYFKNAINKTGTITNSQFVKTMAFRANMIKEADNAWYSRQGQICE